MKKKKIVTLFISIVTMVALGYLAYHYNQYWMSTRNDQQAVDKYTKESQKGNNYDTYLLRAIDFNSLQSQNSDVTTWLTIPHTEIDAPVVQEQVYGRNFYYDKNYLRQPSASGSFFIPGQFDERVDAHTFIMGHRQDDYHGVWMFSHLHKWYTQMSQANAHRFIYVYTPTQTIRYKCVTSINVKTNDVLYKTPLELHSQEYEEAMNSILSRSNYVYSDSTINKDTPTLWLSTCDYTRGNLVTDRFAVGFVMDSIYRNESIITGQDEVDYCVWKDLK